MKIGELAVRTGLTPSRIRFYERIGLLTSVERQANGYRTYSPEAVVMLDLITAAQKADFSLDEIRTLIPSDFAQWQCGSLLDAPRRKVQDIEALEARLARNKAHVMSLIAGTGAKPEAVERAAHAMRLLSRVHPENTASAGHADDDTRDKPARRRTT
ncbi:MerR family transcriptional regulator [Burkholderia stagnalis]|uniref:MerR family transcriptional regulator n=1 Tax=Burkholderia stagnalis TaxID=1503054 RepID=UPI00075A54E4|nr:MerR family transcriptional regulator [Burkholderia stagnalis]KVO50476.1 MerR family transcriptional regulator [Burkholderia stagnalis]KVP08367.1 MerR family transcriptional regulator [Burkholderia stagnalis]KVW93186.1 MerR family transcriptional regulator [Burkholderia stagnalis]KWH71942.1 MerR family transcriptional regulator [Burkholderia stagnalis]